jgi:DNA adenine methylase
MDCDLKNISKKELLIKCKENGIIKCSSKNKSELIKLIENNFNLKNNDDFKINLKPLIKWSGGKKDEIKYFIKYFPIDYNIYLEPFIGGGSVYFYIVPKKAVISDVHNELIDFYKSIQENKSNELYQFMENNNNDELTYYKIRDEMKIISMLDSAKRFYYQRKTCFRGMLRYNKKGEFNIPFGKYKTLNYESLKDKNYENLF